MNRHAVERNQDSNGDIEPVFTVIDDRGLKHHGIDLILIGPSAVRYDRDAEIGTRVWIETWDKVIVKNGTDLTGI